MEGGLIGEMVEEGIYWLIDGGRDYWRIDGERYLLEDWWREGLFGGLVEGEIIGGLVEGVGCTNFKAFYSLKTSQVLTREQFKK